MLKGVITPLIKNLIMKTFKKRTVQLAFKIAFSALMAVCVVTSCKKSSDIKDDDELDTLGGFNNYIPKLGFIYAYKHTSANGEVATIYRSNQGIKDSIGIKVSDIRSTFVYKGQELHMRNKMYNLGGFTITTAYNVDEWDRYVKTLKQNIESSGGVVLENTITGIPFNLLMDNNPKVGSDLTFTGGPTRFHFKAIVGTGDQAMEVETKQTITRHNGKAIKQETLNLSFGKFDCTVWQYQVDNKVETYMGGNLVNVLNTTDKIQTWTKPGFGEIQTVAENSKTGISVTELISIGK